MIFVDTGAFLARYIKADQHHQQAVKCWASVSGVKLATSIHVIDETLTLLARRTTCSFAAETARLLYASNSLTILRTDYDCELIALDYFSKYADQQLSFTDCLSIALLQEFRIRRVFCFDMHFQLAGFECLP